MMSLQAVVLSYPQIICSPFPNHRKDLSRKVGLIPNSEMELQVSSLKIIADGDVERVVARRGIRGIRIDRQVVVHVAQSEPVV